MVPLMVVVPLKAPHHRPAAVRAAFPWAAAADLCLRGHAFVKGNYFFTLGNSLATGLMRPIIPTVSSCFRSTQTACLHHRQRQFLPRAYASTAEAMERCGVLAGNNPAGNFLRRTADCFLGIRKSRTTGRQSPQDVKLLPHRCPVHSLQEKCRLPDPLPLFRPTAALQQPVLFP